MRTTDLNSISKKIFGYEDIATALDITPGSARVAASRYTKQGFMVRIKRNMYLLRNVWDGMSADEKLEVANLLQTPSYISLQTALSFYDLTTQVQQNYFESISLRRSKDIDIINDTFNFIKISPDLYFSFVKKNNVFIADPEKAFIDSLYLMSFGRYKLDISAVDLRKLDNKKIKNILNRFPVKTRNYFNRHARISKT
jgi:predicted transcriptional regulator of viral defense system